jgi:hypothetical protein
MGMTGIVAESARRVNEVGIAPAVQRRVIDFEAVINAADSIAILKLKAQGRLASNTHP